jgi:hypothetical protein
VLSIGRLAPGRQAAAYFLERVGCPLEYYTGRGELAGRWIGQGAAALGLEGALDSPEREEQLRRLLEGRDPDGTELVKPVLRSDPRSRVPTDAVVRALEQEADRRQLTVEELLRAAAPDATAATTASTTPAMTSATTPAAARRGRLGAGAAGERLVQQLHRACTDLDRARRRPRWPAPTMPVDLARTLLTAAALDPTAVLAERTPSGRLRDRFAKALRYREDRVDVRVPGLDLTLSAPKSVSVLFALAPASSADADRGAESIVSSADTAEVWERAGAAGEVGRLVREAHRIAVEEALAYLELHCTSALRGHHRGDGTDTRVRTDGMIGAAFEHRSSRCGDPQLHTHVVVANLLHGVDGKWSALDTREIYAHARPAGFVYQAVLRGELTRTLGVTWGPVRNGQADIAGLPQPLLRLFSKRRVQIEAQLDLVGLDSPAAAQAATLVTRPGKPAVEDGLRLQDRWRDEALAAGFPADISSSVLHRTSPADIDAIGRQAAAAVGPLTAQLQDALLNPTGLTEKKASFDRKDLMRGVCEHLPAGVPVRLAALRALATRVLHDERVVPLLTDAPVTSRRYSTQELLALENDALGIAQRLTDLGDPSTSKALAGIPQGEGSEGSSRGPAPHGTVPPKVLDTARQSAVDRGLSPQQREMVERLLTSGAGVEVIVGAAGSGKTAALAVAAQAWQASGIPVQGAALAAIAARVLSDSAGIPAQSLQRLLNQTDPGVLSQSARVDRGTADGPTATAPQASQVSSGQATLRAGLPRGGVLVIDEAGMVGTRTLHRLLSLAEQTGSKLVLVGDPRQLPEIDAGGLFATLAHRLPTVELTGNQRQQARWEQRALRELRSGDVLRALSAYRQHQRLRISDTVEDLTTRLLDDYENHLRTHTPDQVLVIASSRNDARRLNAQLRQRMLEHGRLGPDEIRIDLSGGGQRGYRTGEQVLVTANDYPLGLLNGTRGTVTALHHDHDQDHDHGGGAVTVRLDDGRNLHLDRDYLRQGRLSHGYALTAHKAQGVTVDVALLWGTHALTRETGYVALSRGRQANYLYSTWDLLRRDAGLTDAADLDHPSPTRRPDPDARRSLTRAGLAERLASSGAQRTARSWWRRPRPDAPARACPAPTQAAPGPDRQGSRSREGRRRSP